MPLYSPQTVANTGGFGGIEINEMFPAVIDSRMEDVVKQDLDKVYEGLDYWQQKTTSKAYEMGSYVASGAFVPLARGIDRTLQMRSAPGFPYTVIPKERKLGISIDMLLIETDQFGVIDQHEQDFMQAHRDTLEVECVIPFATTFNATAPYLCPDGKRLCDSSRPNAYPEAPVWNNLETGGAVARQTISTMRVNFQKTRDDAGMLRPQVMKGVIIAPDKEDTVISELGMGVKWELGSSRIPGSNFNDLNAMTKYGLEYKIWHYLTDPNAWFGYADRSDKRAWQLELYWGHKPTVTPLPMINPRVRSYEFYARYEYLIKASRALRGNVGQ